jgi:rhamnosyltransferase
MNKIKVLSCLVSYRDHQKLKNALQLQSHISVPQNCELHLYIFDNSEAPALANELQALCDERNASLVVLDKNLGVSGAYAKAAQILLEKNYDYLWLWDQDSQPAPNCLESLLNTFSNEFSKKQSPSLSGCPVIHPWKKLGVVLPKLSDPTGIDQHWFFYGPPHDLGKMRTHRFPMDCLERGEVATTYMVNSGALLSKELIQTVGAPNPDFFMDLVDFEYSSRITKCGFRMIVNADTTVLHSVGSPQRFSLLGRTIWARNYPAFRYYYQAKNEILLAKESDKSLSIGINASWRLFLRPIKIYFDRSNTWAKICAHFLGLIDGYRGIKGRSHAKWMERVR